MGQHFTLGAGPVQIMGQHVLPRLYGCRRLCKELIRCVSFLSNQHLNVVLANRVVQIIRKSVIIHLQEKTNSDHKRSGVVYNFGVSVCLSVCLAVCMCVCTYVLYVCVYAMCVCQTITFQSFDVGSSCLLIRYISRQYGSSSCIKVTVSCSRSREQKIIENPYVKLRSAKTALL